MAWRTEGARLSSWSLRRVVLHVALDGPVRDHERLPDPLRREALGHQPQHLGLTVGRRARRHADSSSVNTTTAVELISVSTR
jgi:hypothetical protein